MAAISLFGNSGSDGDIATSENQGIRNRAMEIAKLGNGQAGVYAASLGSGMMMENLAGMAGMKTRTQQKKEGIETILKSYAGKDQNDPDTLFSIAQEMTNSGFPQLAQEFAERARLLSDTQADNTVSAQNAASSAVKAVNSGVVKEGTTRLVGIGNNEMKMQEYKGGKYVDVIDEKTGLPYTQSQFKKDKPSSFEEKKAYVAGLAGTINPDTKKPYTEETLAGLTKALLNPSSTNIVFEAESSFLTALGKIAAEEQTEEIKIAKLSEDALEKTNDVLMRLNEVDEDGNRIVNVGFFSGMRTQFDKVFAFFGDEEAMRSASGTEMLEALLGSDVFPLIKSLGIGARGLDTPAEREFLQKVMTGTIKMEGEALEQLTRLRQKYSVRAIQLHNLRITEEDEDGNTYFGLYEKGLTRKLKEIAIPKLVRPNEKFYDVPDEQGGTRKQRYPLPYPIINELTGEVAVGADAGFVYQYRPNGPLYSERGIDVTSDFDGFDEKTEYFGKDL